MHASQVDGADLGGDPHGVVADDCLVHHACHPQAHLLDSVVTMRHPGRAAQGVAAHGGERAVRVEAVDFEDGGAAGDQAADDQAVGADAGPPGAEALGHFRPVLRVGRLGVAEQDEVVPGPMHLVETHGEAPHVLVTDVAQAPNEVA
ncbi:hypothetical protein M2283_009781 [Streptomyces pseudovenezuelae]|uniref:Uncharacterized protein n=1 Tax=Streptomyces pseudovenezuelae TaxID=67350 RepID=A0ABT6M2S8_9ACTN|nr:hypothetical protein [Streptomyces pseudovenezuelae]